jgi:hypothetical protein
MTYKYYQQLLIQTKKFSDSESCSKHCCPANTVGHDFTHILWVETLVQLMTVLLMLLTAVPYAIAFQLHTLILYTS